MVVVGMDESPEFHGTFVEGKDLDIERPPEKSPLSPRS